MPIASDMGDCLFTAMEIANSALVAPGYYASMGYGVPAGLGAAVANILLAYLGSQYWFRRLHPRRLDSSLTSPRLFTRSGRLVRVVAGAQALLSVYLLAMWVLTQFGQPFE